MFLFKIYPLVTGMLQDTFYIRTQSKIEGLYAHTRICPIYTVCLGHNYNKNGH